ncbi:MAG: hypothetical protein JRD89_07135 [Deltaproteobacteria bacterium]|nr:hypothetical protein [Deltaproteobacteria bacterium]
MPRERFRIEPADPQTTDARVLQFIQTRVLAAKIDQLARARPEGARAERRTRTRLINPKSPVNVRGVYTVVDVRGSGALREFLVRGSAEFTVGLELDGRPVYYDTYGELEDLSQQSDEVAAFRDDDGNYVVHLKDLKFAESLKLTLHGTFTASRLFCKYEVSEAL